MPARRHRPTSSWPTRLLALAAIAAPVVVLQASVDAGAAATTTTVAPTTSVQATTTSPPATTAAPTTSTIAGPPRQSSRRVATELATEKIRPVELPLRTIGVVTGVAVASLALTGLVYGKIRSRVPVPAGATSAKPPTVPAGPAAPTTPGAPLVAPPATALPPPSAQPPPETINDWAPPRPS